MIFPIKTYDDALKYIFREDLTKKYSLENVLKADKILWHPHQFYKIIHVAGTNWKGSVVEMVFSVIKKSGKKVGCFTSPHLIDVRERIETNDGYISKKDFVRYLNKVLATKVSLSYFELCTLIAFLYFKDKWCQYAVIEVWLWWLLDATNIISPVITCITNIWLDHQDILWMTIEKISLQKAGIIKPKIPIILNKKNSVIQRVAKKKWAPVIFATQEKETNLLWKHQRKNAWLAYGICKKLKFSDRLIKQWLMSVCHPGRLQYVSSNLCIDGAHNIDWFRVLKTYLNSIENNYKKIVYCFSLKKWKNVQKLILPIFGRDKEYIIVKKNGYKLEKSILLWKKMQKINHSLKTPSQIKYFAQQNPQTLYMVFGSLYMIGDFIL